jgi:hypothetical protein
MLGGQAEIQVEAAVIATKNAKLCRKMEPLLGESPLAIGDSAKGP